MNHQSDRFLKHNAFARRLGVDHAYLTRLRNSGRAVRDESTGTYDLQHPVNQALVVTAASTKTPEVPDTIDDEELVRLQREKLKFERDRTEAQARKYQISNAVAMRELVTVDLVEHLYGELARGVRSYFLTLPKRIARGDSTIEERAEKAVNAALAAWKADTLQSYQKWAETKTDEIFGGEDDDDARED